VADGDGGDAEPGGPERGADGARQVDELAGVLPEVDAGHDHVVVLLKEPGDREVHAIGRRAVHVIHVVAELEHAQRHVERQRIARTAAIAVGRDDGDCRERSKRVRQPLQAFGAIAVIVADEDSQASGSALAPDLRPSRAAQLYWKPACAE
jgi:hypothetical protein